METESETIPKCKFQIQNLQLKTHPIRYTEPQTKSNHERSVTMNKVILKHTFHLPKIDGYGNGRKTCEVTIDLELRQLGGDPTFTVDRDGTRHYTGNKTPEYTELSICGDVWNHLHTDIIMGGQCLDELAKSCHGTTFKKLYRLWKDWHLNGMKAGTPEQEAAVAEWKAAGHRYDYSTVCEMLKERGLYEIPFTGTTVDKEWHGELYRYGHGWIVKPLPAEIIAECKKLVKEDAA